MMFEKIKDETGNLAGMLSLVDRTVIVTGASQGIGAEFARTFAAVGAKVVLADVNLGKAEELASEISESAGKGAAIACEVDVSDETMVNRMVATAQATYGRVDVLVNNAALFSALKMQPFDEIPLDVWDRVMKVNVNGPFLCSRAVAPVMRKAGYGRIINISSGAINLGRPNYLHYITSKSAMVGMTRSMARELGPHGITVNAILPGSTVTEIERQTVTPDQRMKIVARQCVNRSQRPSDLVSTVLYLALPGTEFVTGQSITVDGGASHP
jgi:NAD(P)-dependent dehydrogenase (short-subunit alcohol dehydrogenase family)